MAPDWRRASRLTLPPTGAAYSARRKLDALARVIEERVRLNARAGREQSHAGLTPAARTKSCIDKDRLGRRFGRL
ncbi:hypothetical protein [Caulobacter sp.]|uniref:hypothetical protein n=1 Tax=Caulobacter sp. TaxID=78 RepID=UPI003BAFD961